MARAALTILLVVLGLIPRGESSLAADYPPIRVNQVGHRPEDPKVALVAAAPADFAVRNAATLQVVFEGKASAPGSLDRASGDRVTALDFTRLVTPGEYVITAPGTTPSPRFRIAGGVYDELLRAVLGTFTTMRCGVPVRDGSALARPACHLEAALEWDRPGLRRDVTGGWHDAGDYGKYVPAAGFALWHLAALHELWRSRVREEAPAVRQFPSLLDEMRWELDWLMRMQRVDGGVHHKVTSVKWTGDRVPHEDRDPQYLFTVSSTATATLAAVTAQAARLFRPHDAGYADRLLAAAEAAWLWLERHPSIVPPGGFRNPAGVKTGEYDDPDDRDDRFWAAVELWQTTGAVRYARPVRAVLDQWPAFAYPPSWLAVHNLGLLTLLASDSRLDPEGRARLRSALAERADAMVQAVEREGYRVALTLGDYYWGSNGVALGRAVFFLTAFRETRRAAFRHAALDQIHYVVGRNALGKSFVTGFGTNPVRRPVFQPTQGHSEHPILPGLLVGGANAQREGVPAPFPARAYVDDGRRYGVNEPAIIWTAVFAYVLGHFVHGGS